MAPGGSPALTNHPAAGIAALSLRVAITESMGW